MCLLICSLSRVEYWLVNWGIGDHKLSWCIYNKWSIQKMMTWHLITGVQVVILTTSYICVQFLATLSVSYPSIQHTLMMFVGVSLTRKVAMAVPMMKPAMTSDQWLRYSATRFRPVRKARHMSPRDNTGLARRVPFACTVHVTYICQEELQGLDHLSFYTSCKITGAVTFSANIQFDFCDTLLVCFSLSVLIQLKVFWNPAALNSDKRYTRVKSFGW